MTKWSFIKYNLVKSVKITTWSLKNQSVIQNVECLKPSNLNPIKEDIQRDRQAQNWPRL